MTEICVPYNTRSTTKVEEDDSGSFQYTERLNMRSQVPKRCPID